MTKTLSFITKSNQILFFVASLLFIAFLSVNLISDLLFNRYEPPKVELMDSSTAEDSAKKQIYTVDFLTLLQDVHIFELSSKVVDTNQRHVKSSVEMFKVSHDLSGGYSGGMYLSDNAVNLMFVKENGDQHMLLEKDALIAEFSQVKLNVSKHAFTLSKNLYLIIDEDTNNNGFFDLKDSSKLFTSSYDGKHLTLVLSDVGSFELTGDDKLIISQKGDTPSFYTFDISNSALVKLNTKINLASK